MGFDKSQQRFRRPQNNSGPTRFLYVSGVGDEMGTKESSLVEIFSQFGEIDFSDGYGIDLVPNRRYCFVCFVEVESAMKALQHFSAEYELPNLPQTKIMVRYAEEVKEKIIPKIDCTSSTNHIEVPGLFLIEEFVNPEEEEGLLSEFGSDNSPWKDSISRRVQVTVFMFRS